MLLRVPCQLSRDWISSAEYELSKTKSGCLSFVFHWSPLHMKWVPCHFPAMLPGAFSHQNHNPCKLASFINFPDSAILFRKTTRNIIDTALQLGLGTMLWKIPNCYFLNIPTLSRFPLDYVKLILFSFGRKTTHLGFSHFSASTSSVTDLTDLGSIQEVLRSRRFNSFHL